ncbi:helix-turn-helix transcriptional regulator [Micromonospora polyrhachis]|uniref:Putative ArsR family transcriptional regulator n=1 Tax=Micromonospora polyrhachis TaxID=1282883 RepID=A0A7W7WSA0_9ACTN|nr:helix-turn-helix domain-containing protein [Micromonospora polyrhachis]MBB4961910.1 putative ArsR family transcriptional regulator [Micromonospora polyrhachis]
METSRTGPIGETIDRSHHRALAAASRVEILKIVRSAEGGMNTAEVAERAGLHLSTTRAHLDRLVEAGLLVKARASGGQPGRPAWRYRATADDIPAPAPYRSLAAALLDQLGGTEGEIRTLAGNVGRNWGRHLAAATDSNDGPVKTVLNVLDGLGFKPQLAAPEAAESGVAEVHLHTCPFLELVGRNPDAMCGLHVGVIRGALEQAGAPASTAVLEPFGAPTACVVRLSLNEPADEQTGSAGGRAEPADERGPA